MMESGWCPMRFENTYVNLLLDNNIEWGTSKSQMYNDLMKHFD